MILNAPRQVMFSCLKINKILSFVFLCLFYSVGATAEEDPPLSTPILDSNFEQALINLNIDTNGLNGNILDSDALAVTLLSISNKSISDLTGIEAFENLEILFASNNNIITADFSQNAVLEIINLENNKISSLNITNNSVLKELLISNNLLNSLDVTSNFQLEYLSCNLNSLDELDVTENTVLKDLRCYSNNLSTINLQFNFELEMLFISDNSLNILEVSLNEQLKTLTFDNNNISTINLSENISLEYLDCSNNNITELDINENTNITRLLCNNNSLGAIDLSTVPDLFLFYAMNNQIETLDISSNLALRFFRAENNLLESLDIRNGENDIISEFVTTQNPNLRCVFVDDSSSSFLADWELDAASTFVEEDSDCESLSINEGQISDFMVYPNPANNQVNIVLNSPKASLKMYTIKGQLLFEKNLAQGINPVNISNFSSGLYVVAIQTEGNITTKKLVIN